MKIPPILQEALHGYTPAKVDTGESGAKVYRFSKPGRSALYLKSGTGRLARQIGEETVRLQWLNDHLPSPRLLRFGGEAHSAWMLTTALPGQPAYECLVAQAPRRAATVRAIAEFLRRLHALPVESCPFLADHPFRMRQARLNLEAGLVDASDFDDQRQGQTAAQVWAELTALVPARVSRVVTHGDFSLDNIFLHRGRVTGLIDAGRLGIADPYQDLAILWNNLAEFGPELQREFLLAYGLPRPDRRKLDFHLCLDEFF